MFEEQLGYTRFVNYDVLKIGSKRITDSIGNSINEIVTIFFCRTAPATPGLFIIYLTIIS